MEQLIARSPNFFSGSAVVLDAQEVSATGSPHLQTITADVFESLLNIIRKLGLQPIALSNAGQDLKDIAKEYDLPMIMPTNSNAAATRSMTSTSSAEHPAAGKLQETADSKKARAAESKMREAQEVAAGYEAEMKRAQHRAEAAENAAQRRADQQQEEGAQDGEIHAQSVPTMIVHHTVRSGQQVYAENTSLVVFGNVSSGAEVLADGDVHIYGRLQGRALAGLSGNRGAKVRACLHWLSLDSHHRITPPSSSRCSSIQS
jgi:septum site-determining protein MinC